MHINEVEQTKRRKRTPSAHGILNQSRPTIETVSGPFGSRFVFGNTCPSVNLISEYVAVGHATYITNIVSGGAKAAISNVDENGYSEERIDLLLRLSQAPLDSACPEAEEDFMDWLHRD